MPTDTLIQIALIQTPCASLVALFVWLRRDRTQAGQIPDPSRLRARGQSIPEKR